MTAKKETNEPMSIGKKLLVFASVCWAIIFIAIISDPKYILIIALASPALVTVFAWLQSLLE